MAETIAQSQNDSYTVSVGTSATVLVEGGGSKHSGPASVGGDADNPRQVLVHNNDGASDVLYVGWGSDLTTSNGLPIPAQEYRLFLMRYTDEMWAIASAAATDARVSVLHGKGDPA